MSSKKKSIKLHELRQERRLTSRNAISQYQRSCGIKQRYFSKADATEAIKKIEDDSLEAYLCLFCQSWHIGHRPRFYRELNKGAREQARRDRRNYLNQIKRLQDENRLLASALADERMIRRWLTAEYRRSLQSKFWWLIDLLLIWGGKGD